MWAPCYPDPPPTPPKPVFLAAPPPISTSSELSHSYIYEKTNLIILYLYRHIVQRHHVRRGATYVCVIPLSYVSIIRRWADFSLRLVHGNRRILVVVVPCSCSILLCRSTRGLSEHVGISYYILYKCMTGS